MLYSEISYDKVFVLLLGSMEESNNISWLMRPSFGRTVCRSLDDITLLKNTDFDWLPKKKKPSSPSSNIGKSSCEEERGPRDESCKKEELHSELNSWSQQEKKKITGNPYPPVIHEIEEEEEEEEEEDARKRMKPKKKKKSFLQKLLSFACFSSEQ